MVAYWCRLIHAAPAISYLVRIRCVVSHNHDGVDGATRACGHVRGAKGELVGEALVPKGRDIDGVRAHLLRPRRLVVGVLTAAGVRGDLEVPDGSQREADIGIIGLQ